MWVKAYILKKATSKTFLAHIYYFSSSVTSCRLQLNALFWVLYFVGLGWLLFFFFCFVLRRNF